MLEKISVRLFIGTRNRFNELQVAPMAINSVSGVSSVINQASAGIERSSTRIASEQRINNAADDAAGQAIANGLTSQINEFSQSIRNANDGISFLQTAEGGLSSLTENLQRLRELSLQAGNGTLNDSDRQSLDREAQQLKDEITRTVENTRFNNQPVLASGNAVDIQVGGEASDNIDISIDDFSENLSNTNFADLSLSTSSGAASALSAIDQLQADVNGASSNIGAQLNRLDSSINTLYNSGANAAESRSRVSDADIARESSELAQENIRRDTSIALAAQANAQGSDILRLLGL